MLQFHNFLILQLWFSSELYDFIKYQKCITTLKPVWKMLFENFLQRNLC